MDACPPLEDIAAFLDSTLSPEECARITEHLARCESCYEIFAGAVHFQEEEEEEASSAGNIGGRDVIQFPLAEERNQEKQVRVEPARPPRRALRWLPLAASVVLAVGLGWAGWRLFAPPKITVASVVEPVEGKVKISDLYQPDVPRGGGVGSAEVSPTRPSFMTGVFLADLRPSLRAQKVKTTQDLLDDVRRELSQIPFADARLVKGYEEDAGRVTDDNALRRLVPEILSREEKVQEFFSMREDPNFSFGLWAEAGRLAAVTQTREFFERRDNRRFLSHLQKVLPEELPEELQQLVLEDLEAIERIWDQGELSQEDYRALASHFQSIIKRIDDYEEDLSSEN
jgi:hypothetical protein